MRKTRNKWIGQVADMQLTNVLAEHFRLHPLVARILATRQCTDINSTDTFLNADRSYLLDPFFMHDMEIAVKRIRQAVERKEKIEIVGDYDVDGVTSSTIMIKTLQLLGTNPDWYIPSRTKDGYGLSNRIVESAYEKRISLIVTVDNGISALDAVNRANELNIDVIVSDHHHISDVPNAFAVVHPAHPDTKYGFHELAGVGVAFKLSQALLGRFPEEFVDLVALGTVADQMPLIGENRILVKEGLYRINRVPNLGIEALLNVAGLANKPITSTHLGFQVAPRINAIGRLAEASRAVELLLTDDEQDAMEIAYELNTYNSRRKLLQEQVENEALTQTEAHPEWLDRNGLCVAGEGWHEGVIGIVSGKIAERFHKPTLCISVDGNSAKGSGRSIPYFSLYDALKRANEESHVLVKWGGHAAAAGFSLAAEDISKLREVFADAIDDIWSDDEKLNPHIICDAPLNLEDLSHELVDSLKVLEPFGQGNPEPIFFMKNALISQVQTMGRSGKHLKLWVKDGIGRVYPVMAFGHGNEINEWHSNSYRNLLVTVGENVWNGEKLLQLQLVDAK